VFRRKKRGRSSGNELIFLANRGDKGQAKITRKGHKRGGQEYLILLC
jgi:hypothetical protein